MVNLDAKFGSDDWQLPEPIRPAHHPAAPSVYIPSQESIKFIAFIRACNVETNSNAELHYRLGDKFFGKHKQVVIESFRGSAKSTIMLWFIIYAAVNGRVENFGEVNFIAFVGDSAENGVKNFFRNVVSKIDKSPLLQSLITIQRKTDGELELINVDGHQLNIKGFGMKTNIRGVTYKGDRPDMVVLDDVTTNEALTSEIIQKTINDNFYKAIVPALHPTKYRIYVIGTPISENDLLHQLTQNEKWLVHRFPVCEKFPCTKAEFKGNWEDRFPYEAVLEKYEMFKASGKLQDFYQEYMLEITDLSTLLVDEDDIKWFDPTTVIKALGSYNIYIATDFATSTKKSADFSTIGVFAISNNNDWMLIDGQCRRQAMTDNINDVFRYARKYIPLSVGIEISGQQGGFLSIMEEEMQKRSTYFSFARKEGSKEVGIRPLHDKVHRFVTGVQPKFKQNKVWLPKPEITDKINPKLSELTNELVNELSKFTLAGGVTALKHDDAIDLLNQLSEMEKFVPTAEVNYTYETAEENGVFGSDIFEHHEEENINSNIF